MPATGSGLGGVARRLWTRASARPRLALGALSADAWLASYPKSGRTWFRFILANYFGIAAGLDVKVDLRSMFGIVPNFDLDPVRGLPAFRFRDRADVPLIVVTHKSYSRLLMLDRPIIFMVREPRDVLVSAYFHETRHKHRFDGDMDAFLPHPRLGLPAYVRHLNGWAERLTAHRHLVLSYETLSADPIGSTMAALAFLGCDADPTAAERAIDASRFEAMRADEQRSGIPGHDYDRNDEQSLRMRRGRVGGFADHLQPRQIAYIEDTCARLLRPAARALLASAGSYDVGPAAAGPA